MYAVSKAYQEAIKGRSRSMEWFGTITLTDGTVHNFTNSNVVENTGTLSRSCSSQSSIDLGGVYASELQFSLRIDIDRYKLSDAVIDLYSRLNYQGTVQTWGDASEYSWEDMTSCRWGDETKHLYYNVPMGVFTVSEALRAVNSVKITAYDNMLNFDKSLPSMDTVARTPFEWLRWICKACDVTLGMTNAFIRSLANGSRGLTFADINNEVSTYRDLLSELAIVCASVAIINRKGELVFMQYGMTPVDTIDSSFRYTSDFSDYQSYYTGIYASYRAKEVQEYFRNVGSLEDNGLIYDIGYNVFLQISSDTNRSAAIQAIIDSQKKNKYTPFNITMPFNPAYDLMDILAFTGNQAATDDIAPITSITYKINDKMTIQCVGENPKLLNAQTKESKAIVGLNDGTSLSGTSYASSDFWIMIDTFPEGTIEITQDTLTTEVDVTTTIDNTRTQILWTGAYHLEGDATVTVDVQVDNTSVYRVSDSQLAGEHVITVSTGHEIDTMGEHSVKVFISGTASLSMSAGMARLSVIGTGWTNTSIDSGDGFTDDGKLFDDIADDLGYDPGVDVDWDIIADTYPDFDWGDVIYTDPDGIIYTDPDFDGIWTDPTTGLEYPGIGDMWIPEDSMFDFSDILNDLATSDQSLSRYSIPDDVLPSLYGGKVSIETHPVVTGDDRPHSYRPAVWYIQRSSNSATLFLGEPFYHATASGGSITVYDDAFSTRDGSPKSIYYSSCTTQFTSKYLQSPYNGYPIQYVAWQCVYGSLDKSLIGKNDNTITTDSIKDGTSGLEYIEVDGKKYYKVTPKDGGK